MKRPSRGGRRGGKVVGFIITPDAIKDKIASLDDAIAVLDGDIRASAAPKLNAKWRAEWEAFRRRWALERDSYTSWSSRLFATYAMPRVQAFIDNYKWWARDYQTRSGNAPRAKAAAEVETMSAALIPDALWWLLAIGVGVYAFTAAKEQHGRR